MFLWRLHTTGTSRKKSRTLLTSGGRSGTLPSTLTQRSMQICWHSLLLRAYFRRSRRTTQMGRHSRSLWGPAEGRGAQTPVILPRFQCLGAWSRLRCFLGPRALKYLVSAVGLDLYMSSTFEIHIAQFPSKSRKQTSHSEATTAQDQPRHPSDANAADKVGKQNSAVPPRLWSNDIDSLHDAHSFRASSFCSELRHQVSATSPTRQLRKGNVHLCKVLLGLMDYFEEEEGLAVS